ncbi:MAG: asparagine synthase (glutamine-hydrolyzing) [Lachnospiraceae bacterium]|nr:asparagine synthase (glutamine-hydrolyzing) [Lachnospiraceae bacterium]
MCGICGFYKLNQNNQYIGEEYLSVMNEQMILRGPDGGNVWLEKDNRCGLGHRRLSIIDLSTSASQPMSNEDGNVVIAFNGEIYNHAEIRKELEEIGGHVWKTDHSDTEMIIHAYEQWGLECIQKFRGMFAIALWDGRKEQFVLIRDRIGIKPLYYMIEDNVLTFASEIKAILKVRKAKPAINEKALYDYLSFLTTPCEQTLFDGIKKLRPAMYMVFDKNGNCREERYWDVWDYTHPELYKADDATISDAILSELKTAVKLRKEADVPVGVFLSGGIDSSTNAALFSEGDNAKVKAFCIGYDQDYESYKNENHYAKMMAEYCNAEYHERLLNQDDLFDFLPEMVRLQDEPIADPVCIPVYYVSKLARDNGIIVAQVGEGSDELFWGYTTWKTYLDLAIANDKPVPNFIKKIGLAAIRAAGRGNRHYAEMLRRGVEKQPIFWSGAEAFYDYDKKRMISDDLRRKLGDYTSFEALRPTYDRYKEKAWEQSHLNWMSYADLNHRLPELLLMRVDKMSMGVSLECRVPFLDHKFVELAMSIPQSKKTEGQISKTVLKKAVRGVIPDEIIDRKKQGFGVPVHDWFLGRLGVEMKKEVLNFANQTGLLNAAYIEKMFDDQAYAAKLWYLFNLALWWKEYIV